MYIYDKKDTDYSLIMQGKVQNGNIGEVYAWIRNKMIVLNTILCWFCSTMLQQTISWMENGR